MSGTFGTTTVQASVPLPTANVTNGNLRLWVRARDGAGNWGTAAAIDVLTSGTGVVSVGDGPKVGVGVRALALAVVVVLRSGDRHPRLAPLVGDERWFAQFTGATLLGAIGSAEVVPLLQPLLRKSDPRVARAAVVALGKIDDAAAARAVQTVLRAATGDLRKTVIDALVVERDPRVVPLLSRVIAESAPLGVDHVVVVEMVDALAKVGCDTAVPTLVTTSRVKRFFGGKKVKVLKEHAVDAMVRIGGTKAAAALDDLALSGDRALRRIVAQKRRSVS